MSEGKNMKLQEKSRKRMQLNRICWLSLSLYHAFRIAIESKALGELLSALEAYNFVTKFITKLSHREVTDGPKLKVLICGVKFTTNLTERLNRSIKAVFEQNAIVKAHMQHSIGANLPFADLIQSSKFIANPDVLIFVSNLCKHFRGWKKEMVFFRAAASYFLRVHMPTCVFVVDAHEGSNFHRLIQLFRKFVPSTARNLQPCFQNKTYFKVWQFRQKEGLFTNLSKILSDAYSACYFKRMGVNLSLYLPSTSVNKRDSKSAFPR
nr:hypothetical transcript [Hymenolepis microstoma]CDS30369.1 hypothetical transcript [Hymenolepis microstoma]